MRLPLWARKRPSFLCHPMSQKRQQRTFITQPACAIFRVHPQPSGYLWPSWFPCITLCKSDHASIVCPIIRVLGELAEYPKTGTSQGNRKLDCDLRSMQGGLDVNPYAGNQSDRRRCNG